MLDLIIATAFIIITIGIILALIYVYFNNAKQTKLIKQILDYNKNCFENLEIINNELKLIKKEKNVNFNSLNDAYKEAYEKGKD